MNNINKRSLSTLFTLVILLLISSTFIEFGRDISSSSKGDSYWDESPLIRIPDYENYHPSEKLSIYDSSLVYTGNGKSVFKYDILSEEVELIIPNGSLPEIFKDLVVYQDNRNGNLDIFLYNISSGEDIRITANESLQGEPKIYGDKIIWMDYRNAWDDIGNFLGHNYIDIYMFDLTNTSEIRITHEIGAKGEPAIFMDLIVWMDLRNDPPLPQSPPFKGSPDLYLYDISSKLEKELIVEKGAQTFPAIWNNYVIWNDNRSGNESIYLYDFKKGDEEKIIESEGEYLFWDIWGDKITYLYQKNKNSPIGIYLYNITTMKSYLINEDQDFKFSCTIYNNYLVWMEDDQHPTSVYLYDLSVDTDVDGKPNYMDLDDDNDGYEDNWEIEHGYDPLDPDNRPPTFLEKYWGHIGILIIFISIIIVYMIKKKKA